MNESTDTDEIRFECPHCEQSLEAPSDMAGESIDCPSCGNPIDVPAPIVEFVDHSVPPPIPEPEIVHELAPVSRVRACPFCSEEILASAIKCKHCGEFLDGRKRQAPQPEKIIVKEKGHSGCGLILIIAFGIIAAIVLMSMF